MSRAFAPLAAAALAAALLPACTHNLTVSYPGGNPVSFPWRTCGMGCEQAFVELQNTQSATGQACDDLVNGAVDAEGGDRFVTAAELYDSALLLLLRGNADEANARFAKAEALDPDPEYKQLEQLARDSAAKFPLPPPSAAPAPAPSAAPPGSGAPAAPAAPPAAAPTPAPAPSGQTGLESPR